MSNKDDWGNFSRLVNSAADESDKCDKIIADFSTFAFDKSIEIGTTQEHTSNERIFTFVKTDNGARVFIKNIGQVGTYEL